MVRNNIQFQTKQREQLKPACADNKNDEDIFEIQNRKKGEQEIKWQTAKPEFAKPPSQSLNCGLKTPLANPLHQFLLPKPLSILSGV